ncbi:MAG: folate-binding protein [Pseudomonadota bacterium]
MPTVLLPDRSLIAVTGADAEHLLQNVITCDLDSLSEGVARPGALLTPQGKILFDFLIARSADSRFVIDIQADQVEAFTKRMTLYKLRSDMTFATHENRCVAVAFGDDISPKTGAVRDERFKGAEVYRWPVERGDNDIGKRDAWDQLRIDNGVAEGGMDYPLSDAFPHDVSLDQNGGVDFKKGCYVGQEVVSRMQHRGTARKRIMIAHSTDDLSASGTGVTANGKPAATLGTVAGNRALMIGRLDRVYEALKEGTPLLAGNITIQSVTLPPNVTYGWPDNELDQDG